MEIGFWVTAPKEKVILSYFSPIPLLLWSKPGVSHLQDLMPDDLRWNWCNNNRNKVPKKCNVLESSWNHLPSHHSQSMEELSSTNQSLGPKSWEPLVSNLGLSTHLYDCKSILAVFLILYLTPINLSSPQSPQRFFTNTPCHSSAPPPAMAPLYTKP